jgi:hypothetical protein
LIGLNAPGAMKIFHLEDGLREGAESGNSFPGGQFMVSYGFVETGHQNSHDRILDRNVFENFLLRRFISRRREGVGIKTGLEMAEVARLGAALTAGFGARIGGGRGCHFLILSREGEGGQRTGDRGRKTEDGERGLNTKGTTGTKEKKEGELERGLTTDFIKLIKHNKAWGPVVLDYIIELLFYFVKGEIGKEGSGDGDGKGNLSGICALPREMLYNRFTDNRLSR